MLISDKYEFIVAMPTKTGTNSMRAVAERWRGDPKVLRLLRHEDNVRHRIAPPNGLHHYDRYMLARDPFSRLISMYEYLRRKHWEWEAKNILAHEAKYGHRVAGWLYLVDRIAEIKHQEGYYNPKMRGVHGVVPYKWTDTPGCMQAFLQGFDADESRLPWFTRATPGLLRLEVLQDDWDALLKDRGVTEPELFEVAVPHRNATRTPKLFEDDRLYMDAIRPGVYRRVCGWERTVYLKYGLYHRAS